MNVKRKSRKLLLYKEGTGGRPASKKELTDLEEQLLQLISKIHLGDHEVMDSFNIEAGTSRIEEDPESSQVIIDLVEDALLVDANQSVEGPTASKQKAFVDSESVPLAIARTIRKKKIGTHRQSADLQNIIKDLVCTHQEKKIEKGKLKLETWYKHSSIIHLENSISKPTKNKRKHLVPILDTSHSTIVYQKPGGKAQLYNSCNVRKVLELEGQLASVECKGPVLIGEPNSSPISSS
ncbi:hypothetical protein RN001_001892 [Aquatica leii]|uniref:Uncharacterized protein n=1 Tax=Aquatica leii TaxID=1421715 RepID=A0AAN7PP61_9COLE|nr:hypothetical protein RN001_001892 [Aquatica leii]